MYHMVQTTVSVAISAPAEQVWQTLMAVEAYPEWTASMRRVERVSGPAPTGPAPDLRIGEQVRITQPRLGTMTWTVSLVDANRRFDWAAKRGLVTITASHTITPQPEGVTLELTLTAVGLGSGLASRLTRRMTERYVAMEAAGCRARSEARAAEAHQSEGEPRLQGI